MILSDLIDAAVFDVTDTRVGRVIDVRLSADDRRGADRMVLRGLIVSPHTGASFLGYERRDITAPALIARWLRWRHRGSFLVLWEDVAIVQIDRVRLRSNFVRYSPALPDR